MAAMQDIDEFLESVKRETEEKQREESKNGGPHHRAMNEHEIKGRAGKRGARGVSGRDENGDEGAQDFEDTRRGDAESTIRREYHGNGRHQRGTDTWDSRREERVGRRRARDSHAGERHGDAFRCARDPRRLSRDRDDDNVTRRLDVGGNANNDEGRMEYFDDGRSPKPYTATHGTRRPTLENERLPIREKSRPSTRDGTTHNDSPPSTRGSGTSRHNPREHDSSRRRQHYSSRRTTMERRRSRSRSPVRRDGRYRRSRTPDRHERRRYRSRSPLRTDRSPPRRRSSPVTRRSRSPRHPVTPKKPVEPQLTEDERDRRTIFVQQLAARLRTKELIKFFEDAGPVQEAQIVKDRVSGRSKGVGYVEFKEEESVAKAIKLTGHVLLGIPIIAQHTEAEKNRQAKTNEGADGNTNVVPFHRLYVGNVHFSITEEDLDAVFNPFGELEFVQLQKDDTGRSRGYGFVQFREPAAAKSALESMNGFHIANRPIRVGLGNDRFTAESTASMLQRFPTGSGATGNFQGSAFSGAGGRGAYAGGSGGNFDRAGGGRYDDKKASGASALDDTDVAGVNYANYSRDSLMRKLARMDDPADSEQSKLAQAQKAKEAAQKQQMYAPQPSRCVLLKNMFDPAEETGTSWVKELEEDIKGECDAKYGKVVHLAVDEKTVGDVYIKFENKTGGENAIKSLNGRFFGGRTVSASYVVEAIYNALYSNAAKR